MKITGKTPTDRRSYRPLDPRSSNMNSRRRKGAAIPPFFLFVIVAVLLTVPLACRRQTPSELVEQAMTAASAGDWSYAKAYAEKAVSRDSRNLQARMLLGISHHYLEQENQAVNNLRQAAEKAPSNFTAQYLYGWILSENSDYTEALPPLRRAYEIDNRHHNLLTLLARASLEQNLIEGVRYLQLLMARPEFQNQAEAFNAIALLWVGEADYSRAGYFFRQALQRDPDNPIILQNLAVLYDVYLHDENNALDYYRRCLVASQRINDRERIREVTDRLRQLARRRGAIQ